MDTMRPASVRMPALLKTALLLAIVGALNWGLIGFFDWNLVDAVLGGGAREATSTASRVVYALVGLAGLTATVLLLSSRTEHHGDTAAGAPLSR